MSRALGDVTLAIREDNWLQLTEGLARSEESAWVMGARLANGVEPVRSRATLFVRDVMPVPDEAYELRTSNRLIIQSRGWLPAFARADRDGSIPLFAHTHPCAEPKYSPLDRIVDDELANLASARNQREEYGSLVIGGSVDQPIFAGRFYHPDIGWQEIRRIRVVGKQLRIIISWATRTEAGEADARIFDRQVRAFGPDGQAVLKRLRVGIVGAGGTGSAVAEQLLRLGVGEIIVIDGQLLDRSNVTRVYGSQLENAGTSKAEIVFNNAAKVGLGTTVRPYQSKVTALTAAERLAHCDVVFGCTDDHAGRAVLTRMPAALLQILIDCGVKLDSKDGNLKGIYGRVSVVDPGGPCLMCHGDVDPARIRDETMSADELALRQQQGYAPELDIPDPAVITYTTMTAALAVNELLGRLFGFAAETNHLLLLAHDRRISHQRRERVGRHRCGDQSKLASGLQTPFLDWSWGTEK